MTNLQPLNAADLCRLMPSMFKEGAVQKVGWHGVTSFIKPVAPTKQRAPVRRERISPSL